MLGRITSSACIDDMIIFTTYIMIDTEGNILYSVSRESDLGTNLFHGPHSETLFARGVETTLETGQVRFSDLERYAPSKNSITGFLTTPILDESGGPPGVFAIQLHLETILGMLHHGGESGSSLSHYLVGNDGLLRSRARGDSGANH